MKNAKKHLKVSSILVLVLATLTLVKVIAELIFGALNNATVPEGAPDNIIMITKMFLLMVALMLVIPQIYIGIKGLWASKHTVSSKGHIVVAIVLFVLAVLGLISPIVGIVKQEDVLNNVGVLLSLLLEAVIYFDYFKCAIAVSKAK